MLEASYAEVRRNLARLLESADEFAGLMETAHLLRSPRNAARLLAALRRALKGNGRGPVRGCVQARVEA